ncbi:MAG TPA: ABC transporter permease, partial [Pirellulales bacterium]|nr:ABC transporter permease [Pirellulales bacterium]
MFASLRHALARREHWFTMARVLAARLGRAALARLEGAAYIVSIAFASLALSVRRSTWKRTVRTVFVRQILFTAVDGLAVAMRIGGTVGVLLVAEAAGWLVELGATAERMAPWLMAFTIRELGPLIANLIVIGRSGVAISTELANMKLHGELDVLESLGIDVMSYLVVPRVLCVALSVLFLAVVIVASIFVSSYTVGVLAGAVVELPWEFFDAAFVAGETEDLVCFLTKTIVTGLFVGAICCREGLRVRLVATEVPRVASR